MPFTPPNRPAQPGRRGKVHHDQIHAKLDQKEQALQAELKKVKAVRTLLPPSTQDQMQQQQQPQQRPRGR